MPSHDATLTPAGLVLPDARLRESSSLWSAESSITYAEPIPGRPVLASSSGLVLEAHGDEQEGSGLSAVVLAGGQPRDEVGWPTVGWTRTGEETRHWEPPVVISGSRVVAWAGASDYTQPAIVGLASGRLLVAAVQDGTDLVVWYSDDEGLTWTGPTTVYTAAAVSSPCLVDQGEEGVLLLCEAGQSLRVLLSLDGGETWPTTPRQVRLGVTAVSMAAAYSSGEVLLLVHYRALAVAPAIGRDRVRQYMSADYGATWEQVGTLYDVIDEGSGWPACAGRPQGGFVAAWLALVSSTETVGRVHLLPTARADLSDVTSATDWGDMSGLSADSAHNGVGTVQAAGPAYDMVDADVCCIVDDAGWAWTAWRRSYGSVTGEWALLVAPDGETWAPVGRGEYPPAPDASVSGYIWHTRDTGGHWPSDARMAWHRGRVLWVHGFAAQEASASGPSVIVTQLGGWSTLTTPALDVADVELQERATFERTHLPIERLLDVSDWTGTTAGAYTWALSAAGYEGITTGDGVGTAGTAYATWTRAADGVERCWQVQYEVRATQAASVASPDVACRLRLETTAPLAVQVSIRHLPGTIALYDDLASGGAGAALAAWASLDTGLPVQVRVGVSLPDEAVRVWWRQPSAPLAADREWTELGSGPHALTTAAAGTIGNAIRIGHIASSGAGSQTRSRWYQVHHACQDPASTSTAEQVGPWHSSEVGEEAPGRPLRGLAVYLADGVSVASGGGSATPLEEAAITPTSERPIARVWPSVALSPRAGARLAQGTEQRVALALYSGATAYECELPPVSALAVYGCNWPSATVQGYTSGAWSTIGTLDLSGGLSLPYTRRGSTLVPSSIGTTRLLPGELVGATLALGSYRRRVIAQSEGLWSSTTDGPMPHIVLEGVTGSEPSSGTATPWYTSGLMLWAPGSTRYAGLRLVLASSITTVDGWLDVGVLLVGRVYPLARPDWGGQTSRAWRREVSASDAGYATLQRRGPSSRVLSIDWAESGADLTDLRRAAVGGSYYRAGPTQPGATRGGVALELLGLSDRDPVVYLPRLDPDASLPRSVVRPDQHLLALPDGPPELRQRLGQAGVDEWVTVGSLVMRELV